MSNIIKRYSLPLTIAAWFTVINLLAFLPLNNYIYSNISEFNTIYKDEQRLYDYDRMPGLSMRAHQINTCSGLREATVIIVGDSKTEDFYVSYEDSVAAKLDRKMFGEKEVPYVFNFGSSGTKTVYAMERIKKAAGYNPDLIIWQMGSGSFPPVRWALPGAPYSNSAYDLSLGGNLAGAYSNLPKLNDQNAPFVSAELRGAFIPLFRYAPFYLNYFRGLCSEITGKPLFMPEDHYIEIGEGEGLIPQFKYQTPFDSTDKYFGSIGAACSYIREKGFRMMIYIDQIRPDVRDQKFEEGYYEKLVAEIRLQASPYGVPVLDLHEAVPFEYFVDGGHIKERGNEIIASGLYEFITGYYGAILPGSGGDK
ncbi:MAG: SGNH/GDSL hydrolase family protein [Eubacteriales bacterium]|nr:SGNH/GDSL hydrolase family protein [Eubacteriales bacterium]